MKTEKYVNEARAWFFALLIITVITATYLVCNAQYIAFGLILLIGFPCILYHAEEAKIIDNGEHPGGKELKTHTPENNVQALTTKEITIMILRYLVAFVICMTILHFLYKYIPVVYWIVIALMDTCVLLSIISSIRKKPIIVKIRKNVLITFGESYKKSNQISDSNPFKKK